MVEIAKTKYRKQIKIPAMNANSVYRLQIPRDAIDTHHFFNELTIFNTSTNNLEFTPDDNEDRSFFVPAKGSISWSFKDDNMKYSSLVVTERSAAALTANLVQVIVVKKRYEEIRPGDPKEE